MDATAVNVIALLLSPVIAVGVTLWYQYEKERRDAKVWILNTLVATRHQVPPTDEQVRALNMVDIVFRASGEVRRLWHEYFEMLNDEGLQNPLGHARWGKKYLEMLTAMAQDVGYGRRITHLDIDRVYNPISLGKQNERAQAISDELLRVLKGSQGLAVTPAPAPSSLPPGQSQP